MKSSERNLDDSNMADSTDKSFSNTVQVPTFSNGVWLSSRLSDSEVEWLRQRKRAIAAYVQTELPERLKMRGLAHLLTGMKRNDG